MRLLAAEPSPYRQVPVVQTPLEDRQTVGSEDEVHVPFDVQVRKQLVWAAVEALSALAESAEAYGVWDGCAGANSPADSPLCSATIRSPMPSLNDMLLPLRQMVG